jgi:hypothetical protein
MSELDLLNLVRSATQNEVTWFTQIITINFAMIVAIYYFLNQARIALKVFSFVAYMVGSLIFVGQMLIEGNVKLMALAALKALPSVALPTRQYIGVTESWLGLTTAFVFNASVWVLWLGIFYLLFFWKKSAHEPR